MSKKMLIKADFCTIKGIGNICKKVNRDFSFIFLDKLPYSGILHLVFEKTLYFKLTVIEN